MYGVDVLFGVVHRASVLFHFHLNRQAGERMDRKLSTIDVSLTVDGEPPLRFAPGTFARTVLGETGGADVRQISTGPLLHE